MQRAVGTTGIARRAGKLARWSLPPALLITFAFAIAGAAAAGPGGWDHLGEFKTPKVAALNGAVYALSAESDNGLLVGGNFNFTTADGRPAAHLAVWYPTQFWTAYATPTPLNGDVHAIAWDSAHVRLFVGGNFTNAGGNSSADFLAVWNGSNWAPFCTPAPAFSASVAALQIVGSTLYVGGSFANGAGISSADYLLACDLNTGVARSTAIFDGDFNGGVYALTSDANGTLYAGGQFINVEGISAADHVASYDGTWHAMGTGSSPGSGAVDSYVRSLASSGSNVYIGTDSVNVAGISQADHVAKWNGSAWSALGANSAGTDGWLPASAFIYALAAKGSQVVATGSFQNANGILTADNVASFDGTAWKPLGSNGAGNGPWIGNGLAVAILGEDIFVGGNFTSAGGDGLASYVARYGKQVAPSNAFTITSVVKRNLAKGTATLTVKTPGQGKLMLSGAKVRKVTVATPSSPAKVKLTVRATGASKKKLNRLGHVKVKVKITFTPTGGTAKSHSKTVALRKR
ncbi:MAG: autotransporter outer membrane beta-barrel domain-containing protein [Gaiellaceae bacterium]